MNTFRRVFLFLAAALCAARMSAAILRVPTDFATIQAAVNAASPGDTVLILGGTYGEKVVVATPDIRLVGAGFSSAAPAVVDGTGLTGFGIHVRGTAGAPISNVEVVGLIVRNFERGIVLENASGCRVRANETHGNVDKETSTLDSGDGIVLIGSSFSEVTDSFSHDNGHNGIFLTGGSRTNIVRANRVRDNGAQRPNFAGCSIELGGGTNNNNNTIVDNDIPTGHWGIRIGPGGTNTGNLVARNRVTGHVRAGVAIRGPSGSNVVTQNDATGNSTGNIAPSFQMDLYDDSTGPPNVWEKNRGRRAVYVPVVGRVTGARGETFVSDLRLANLSAVANSVTIDYFASSSVGGTAPTASTTVTVQPTSQTVLNDALTSLFSTTGVGAFRIIADHDILATSRVLNDRRATNEGTTGLLVPAMEIDEVCANGTLPMLSNAARADVQNGIGFRTNIGYFNPLGTAANVTFTLNRSDGSVLSTKTLSVPGFSRVQLGVFELFDAVAEQDRAQQDFLVTYSVTGGPLIVYAVILDNRTGDGLYLTGLCNL